MTLTELFKRVSDCYSEERANGDPDKVEVFVGDGWNSYKAEFALYNTHIYSNENKGYIEKPNGVFVIYGTEEV